MTLILQIALGIVLAILILAFWPVMLAFALIAVGILAIFLLVVGLGPDIAPALGAVSLVLGVIMLIALAAFVLHKVAAFFLPQKDTELARIVAAADSEPFELRNLQIWVGLILLVNFIAFAAIGDSEGAGAMALVLMLAIYIAIWAAVHFALWRVELRGEKRRQWRIARRKELGMSSTEQAPEPTMDEILASFDKIIADDDQNAGT